MSTNLIQPFNYKSAKKLEDDTSSEIPSRVSRYNSFTREDTVAGMPSIKQ
jgi:hypothetical protein